MRDRNVFHIAFLNCFWPDGRLNRTRTWREVRYLARFLSSWLFVFSLFLVVCATPIVLVHSYVVPIPIALKIFGAYHIDREVWEYNIEKGDLGDVEQNTKLGVRGMALVDEQLYSGNISCGTRGLF